MKTAKIALIVLISSCLLISVIIVNVNGNNKKNVTDRDDKNQEIIVNKEITTNNEFRYIQIMEDKIFMKDYKMLKQNCSLIVVGKITEAKESFFESYLNSELTKEYQSQGIDKAEYCNIYTNYTVKVEQILYGDCEDTISYRALSGQIEDVVVDEVIPIKENYSYLFVLKNSKKESGVYENALGYNAVAKIEGNEIIENNIVGQCFQVGINVKELETLLSS